jgi:hypothetical protein
MIELIIAHINQYIDMYVLIFSGGCAYGSWRLSKEPSEEEAQPKKVDEGADR